MNIKEIVLQHIYLAEQLCKLLSRAYNFLNLWPLVMHNTRHEFLSAVQALDPITIQLVTLITVMPLLTSGHILLGSQYCSI